MSQTVIEKELVSCKYKKENYKLLIMGLFLRRLFVLTLAMFILFFCGNQMFCFAQKSDYLVTVHERNTALCNDYTEINCNIELSEKELLNGALLNYDYARRMHVYFGDTTNIELQQKFLKQIQELKQLEYLGIRGCDRTDLICEILHNVDKKSIRCIGLSHCKNLSSEIVDALSKYDNLEQLVFFYVNDISDDFVSSLTKLHNLKKLTIMHDENTERFTGKTLEKLQKLELLSIEYVGTVSPCPFTHDFIVTSVNSLTNLESVSFHNLNISNNAWQLLNNKNIKKLHIEPDWHIILERPEPIHLDFLFNLEYLEELKIDSSISNNSATWGYSSFQDFDGLPHLKKIDWLSSDSLHISFFQWLTRCPQLKSIRVTYNGLICPCPEDLSNDSKSKMRSK